MGTPILSFSLRELRGAPISVLIALYLARQAVAVAWLERTTGYSYKTAVNALGFLRDKGIVLHSLEGWKLTPAGELFTIQISGGWRKSNPINTYIDLNSDSLSLNINNNNLENFQPAEKTAEEVAIWKEMAAAGIQRNNRTEELAHLPHISPEYVRAHRLNFEEMGKGGVKWSGLLITTLERGEPAPKIPEPIICPVCNSYPCDCEWISESSDLGMEEK